MSGTSVAARYRSVQVQTCTPGQLVVMLFDGALRFLGEAQKAMAAKDRARAGERISKAHAVLEELASTLDTAAAPELAENLQGLYFFCMRELLQANLTQDPEKLAKIAEVLRPVRDGFDEIVRKA